MEPILLASSILLWIVVLGNLLLTLALIRRSNTSARAGQSTFPALKAGEEAPDFSAQTLNGETVTRATYDGRKTAFVFISTHCQPCRDILPAMEELGPKAARSGVEIVLVSNETVEITSAFITEMDIHLPVLVAPSATNTFTKDYQATSTPSYCLVNEQGKVQSAGYPSMDWGEWKALADSWKQDNTISILAGRR